MQKTFTIRLSILKLLPNFIIIKRVNLALLQILSNLYLSLNLFLYFFAFFNSLIDNSVDEIANLVDEIDEAATIYNDKMVKFSALHAR